MNTQLPLWIILLCIIHTLPAQNLSIDSGITYALVIGISNYQDEAIPDLRFADKDAEAFAHFLRSPAGGALDEGHLKILLNEQATAGQIAAALYWLIEECKEDDEVIIYFSGHGDVERKIMGQPGFLLCWDAPSRVYMAGGVVQLGMMQSVISTLSLENKSRVVVIADACRSGKLSGSSINGSQLTNANLAKKYANEIKILSCQPDEYSIEGEQWGGGRGAFSYHLLDGLAGLADSNKDHSVSLLEIGRYLEDHVTTEVAPHIQIPMTVGNRSEKLITVNPEELTVLKKSKKEEIQMFSGFASKGIEDEILESVDTSIQKMYFAFQNAIKAKRYLNPKNNCAGYYYEQLIAIPELKRMHSAMRRNYAAALQDDAQQVINSILKTDINEMILGTNLKSKISKYEPYPTYLDRAAQLLGERHYMYKTLLARKAFFQGYLTKLKNYKIDFSFSDTKVLEQGIKHFREALELQPDFPHVFLEMSELFRHFDRDSSEFYMQKAKESAPNWLLPYVYHSNFTKITDRQKTKEILEKAIEIDSNSTMILLKLADYYRDNDHFVESEYYYKKLLNQKDAAVCYSCVHNNLGMLYSYFNRYPEAEEQYKKVIEIDPDFPLVYTNMGQLLNLQQRFEEAEPFLLKALEMDTTNSTIYLFLANNYTFTGRYELADSAFEKAILHTSNPFNVYYDFAVFTAKLGRLEKAEECYFNAIEINSKDVRPLINLASLYIDTKRYEKAETKLLKAIELDSNHMFVYANLFSVYQSTKRFDEAEKMILKAISISPNFIGFRNALGEFYLNRNRPEDAMSVLKEEIAKAPDFPNPYIGLAMASARLNEIEKTWDYLNTACQKGFADQESIQTNPDFEILRKNPEKWNAFVEKYFPEPTEN